MLNTEERRFLRNWEDQRKDGKGSYFLLYIIAGTIVMTIGVFFVASMIRFGRPKHFWPVPLISLLIMVVYTVTSWNRSEKKWRTIIKREMTLGESEKNEGS